MYLTRMAMPRRTFLRGVGATLALPLLDAMVPAATALAQTPARPIKRFGAVYVPHGAIMNQWTPATTGADFEFSPILKPLEPFRDNVVVTSGLGSTSSEGLHAPGPICFLSGVKGKKTEGDDIYNGITIDQVHRQADRSEHGVPVDRGRDRGLHRLRRRLRRRLELRLPEHDLVADGHQPAADGDQSARGVRAAVRRHRHARRSARRAGASAGACSTRCIRGRRSCSSELGGPRSAAVSTTISRTSARSSAASSRPRAAPAPTSPCPTRRSASRPTSRSTPG